MTHLWYRLSKVAFILLPTNSPHQRWPTLWIPLASPRPSSMPPAPPRRMLHSSRLLPSSTLRFVIITLLVIRWEFSALFVDFCVIRACLSPRASWLISLPQSARIWLRSVCHHLALTSYSPIPRLIFPMRSSDFIFWTDGEDDLELIVLLSHLSFYFIQFVLLCRC